MDAHSKTVYRGKDPPRVADRHTSVRSRQSGEGDSRTRGMADKDSLVVPQALVSVPQELDQLRMLDLSRGQPVHHCPFRFAHCAPLQPSGRCLFGFLYSCRDN
jgi:hypothetical protein